MPTCPEAQGSEEVTGFGCTGVKASFARSGSFTCPFTMSSENTVLEPLKATALFPH